MSALSDLITAEGTALATAPISKAELLQAIKELAEMSTSSGLTRAECIATNFSNPPASIRTTGYYSAGDYGRGLYIKKASQPDHKGKFQTADGTWYELVPEHGQVWVEQFGAQNVAVWNDTFPDAAPACNDCVDYIVFSGYGLCEMRFGPGQKYIASSIQLKGGSFNVKGQSTWASNGASYLRPAINVDLFVCHHPQWSFEKDGGVYYGNRMCMVGEKCYFQDPGTAGQVTHSYIVASVTGTATRETNWGTTVPVGYTSSSGASAPTGTSNGQVDGSVVWNYYRETTRVERSNQYFIGVISDLIIYSMWNRATDPYGTACGIFARSRVHVRNCWIGNMSMHGIAIIANGDPELPWSSGNVNGWRVETCSLYYHGMDGLHIGYSDANAGTSMHLDIAENGRWGLADWCFLGDSHYGNQDAYSGNHGFGVSRKHHACCHNGAYWVALLPNVGIEPWRDWNTVEPGTNASVWHLYYTDSAHDLSPSGNFVDWETNRVANPTFMAFNQGGFEPGGSFSANNVNARNRWDGHYIEGSDAWAQWGARDLITGGPAGQALTGLKGTNIQDGIWYNNLVTQAASQVDYTTGVQNTWQVSMGPYDGYKNNGLFQWYSGGYAMALSFDSGDIVMLQNGQIISGFNWNTPFRLCTPGSGYTAGKVDNSGNPVAVGPGALALRFLCVGSGGASYQRQLDIGNSGSTAGYHGRGDIVFNIDAAVGSPMGWMCVTAGNPGTWGTMPNLV